LARSGRGWQDAGFDPVAVAVTSTFYEPSTGQLRRARITVNDEDYDFIDLTRECGRRRAGLRLRRGVDPTRRAHFIGLDHTSVGAGDKNDPTMAPTVDPCDREKRTLAPDDVAGLCRILSHGGAAPDLPLPADPGPLRLQSGVWLSGERRSGAPLGLVWCFLTLGIGLLRSRDLRPGPGKGITAPG
jgi:hypothetical protein